MALPAVRWPDDFPPGDAPVHSRNALRMDSPAERVWAWLVRAPLWHTWYRHCRRLRLENAPGPDLALGTRFTWATLGVRVDTTVEEWAPGRRLAWRGTGLGAEGYHAWALEPDGTGCQVVTEEAQRGLFPSLGRVVLRRALRRVHDEWLAALARVARTGPPPDVPA
jgi:Polyketide cyclase / dehydrase and lipid transport